MTSSNPWEQAQIPRGGDATEDAVFVSIGRALSQWEYFEMWFAQIFSVCVSDNQGIDSGLPAQRAYGAIMTYRGRADMVKAAFAAFMNNKLRYEPETDKALAKQISDEFSALVNRSNKYSPRRNEIAHGFVQEWIDGCGDSCGFALFPTSYSTNKNSLAAPDEAQYQRRLPWPDYIYSSAEIGAYGEQFSGLQRQSKEFLTKLIGFRHNR